jgi:Mrp family chromosome partitioning ATPase
MLGTPEQPAGGTSEKRIGPAIYFGMRVISIGFFVERGGAVIWRGPMVSGAIRQFYTDVHWGDLEYLIVDLPPGTSDAPLTVMQALPVAGVVLVTTPQALATMVVTKAVRLVKQLGGDILGVVENMAYVTTPSGERLEVFGPSQGLKLVIAANASLLARIPIDPRIADLADHGRIEEWRRRQRVERTRARRPDLVADFPEHPGHDYHPAGSDDRPRPPEDTR